MRMKRIGWFCVAFAFFASAAWAGSFKVLILVGDARSGESAALQANTKVGPHTFSFEEVVIEGGTFDGDFRGADIVWFPWNGPGHDGNYFMDGSEEAFVQWVEEGHGVWISAFDDNYRDPNGDQVGSWMPIDKHPITVMNTGDSDVDITAEGEASGLFSDPNNVDMNAITLDDNFANLDSDWVILATRADNKQPAATYLPWGKGIYLEVCIDTRDAARLAAAEPLLPNGLLFLANYLEEARAVDPAGKLATTWGDVKTR